MRWSASTRWTGTNSQGQIKAWTDVWSAGQGVESVRAIEPVAAIVRRLEAEYAEAVRAPAFA